MPEYLHLYQIVVLIIAFAMIYQGIHDFLKKKGNATFLKLFTRVVVWGGMAVVAIFPKVTSILAQTIGVGEDTNAVMLTGFILIFLIIFKLLSAIERLESQISVLVRKKALKKLKNSIKE